MSHVERQARYRQRKNAALQAMPDDPLTTDIPMLEAVLTLDDVIEAAGNMGNEVMSTGEQLGLVHGVNDGHAPGRALAWLASDEAALLLAQKPTHAPGPFSVAIRTIKARWT